MAMLIATAVISHHAYFAMPVIPTTASVVIALSLLHPRATHRPIHTFFDLVLTCVHLGMIIPYIVGVREGWGWRMHYDDGLRMLACYASFPPLAVFGIHAYFIIRAMFPNPLAVWNAMLGCATCPHCQKEIRADPRLLWDFTPNGSRSSGSSTHSHDNKGNYANVPDVPPYQEDETVPRPSTDDEAARLV